MRFRGAEVVAAREIFLDEHVEHDEQIPASHLLNAELRLAGFTSVPVGRHDGPGISAHDRLERYLHRDVEMRRNQRATAFDSFLSIGLKGVGGVVEFDAEQEFQEMVAKALDEVPEEFDREWNNVAVTVRTDWPTEAEKKRMGVAEGNLVFGTYSGTSRTKGYRASSSSPHVIVIYQPALEMCYGSDKARLEQEIRHVVLHELAHHLGWDELGVQGLGL